MTSASPQPAGDAPVLRVQTFALGPFETNCYVIRREGGTTCWVIDASFGPGPMLEYIRRHNLSPSLLALTHAHADHIGGIPEFRRAWPGLPIAIHAEESSWLGNPELNLSAGFGAPVSVPGPDRTLADGDQLELDGVPCTVIHTPGHSPGGVGFYFPTSDLLVAGDALFAGSIGRTDLPGGDFARLQRSIRERYYTLPDRTVVLPGHGPRTTIGHERLSNPFVRA